MRRTVCRGSVPVGGCERPQPSGCGARPICGPRCQEAFAAELPDELDEPELLLDDESLVEVDDELLLEDESFDDEEDESELDDESEPESLLPTVDPERLSVR
jgi:hypothetical protein